jgi:putative DNA primase/helicase
VTNLYNPVSLRQALGDIPIIKLPHTDRTKDGYSKTQPATLENIAAGLDSLNVVPRINLMNATVSFRLPRCVAPAGFGTMGQDEVDQMVLGALADCFARVGMRARDPVKKLIIEAALSHRFHPMLDLVKATTWDGQDHYSRLLGTVRCSDPDWLAIYLRRWLLQTVECFAGWEKRKKSQKALALVLVGGQGIGKSRWLTSLVPDEMGRAGVHLNLTGVSSRDSKHEALKQLVTELGEIGTTTRKTAVEDLKAFLADPADSYRLPYGVNWTDRPRCTSFAGTTNNAEPLVDTTGNRRFLIVEVEKCNPEHRVDLAQLWAQVHSWWQAGEQWWLTPDEEKLQATRNLGHTQADAMEERIATEIERRQREPGIYRLICGLNVTQVLTALGQDALHPQTRGKTTDALTKLLGRSRTLNPWGGGKRSWPWACTQAEATEAGAREMSPGWEAAQGNTTWGTAEERAAAAAGKPKGGRAWDFPPGSHPPKGNGGKRKFTRRAS